MKLKFQSNVSFQDAPNIAFFLCTNYQWFLHLSPETSRFLCHDFCSLYWLLLSIYSYILVYVCYIFLNRKNTLCLTATMSYFKTLFLKVYLCLIFNSCFFFSSKLYFISYMPRFLSSWCKISIIFFPYIKPVLSSSPYHLSI